MGAKPARRRSTRFTVLVGGVALVGLAAVAFCAQTLYAQSREHEAKSFRRRQLAEKPSASGLLSTAMANNICVQSYDGDGISTVWNPLEKPIKMDFRLYPCPEFSDSSCCTHAMAGGITEALQHLLNVGGTGGTPIRDDRCMGKFWKEWHELSDYMCLACNPKQIEYIACCDDQYKKSGYCRDDTGAATDAQLMVKYGTGTCVGDQGDTVRICKSFADKLWETDGKKYDSCGMNMYVLGDPDSVADENAWSDDDDGDGEPDGNPNEVMPWGDTDGRTGDDAMLPSRAWDGGSESFFHDVKAPFFDQFRMAVVADADGDCFDGFASRVMTD